MRAQRSISSANTSIHHVPGAMLDGGSLSNRRALTSGMLSPGVRHTQVVSIVTDGTLEEHKGETQLNLGVQEMQTGGDKV